MILGSHANAAVISDTGIITMNCTEGSRAAVSSDERPPHLRTNTKQAWVKLTAGLLSYESACRDGQLPSETVGERLISQPVLTRAAITAMTLHLGNAIPKRYDVVSLGFQVLRQASRYLALVTARMAG
jgi:hypothetical protein